jgi:hypothetical protein
MDASRRIASLLLEVLPAKSGVWDRAGGDMQAADQFHFPKPDALSSHAIIWS